MTTIEPIRGLKIEIDQVAIIDAISDHTSRWIKATVATIFRGLQLLGQLAISTGRRIKGKVVEFASPPLLRWAEQVDEQITDYIQGAEPLHLSAVREPPLALPASISEAQVAGVIDDGGAVEVPEVQIGLPSKLDYFRSLDRPCLLQRAKGRVPSYFRLSNEELAEALVELEQEKPDGNSLTP